MYVCMYVYLRLSLNVGNLVFGTEAAHILLLHAAPYTYIHHTYIFFSHPVHLRCKYVHLISVRYCT